MWLIPVRAIKRKSRKELKDRDAKAAVGQGGRRKVEGI